MKLASSESVVKKWKYSTLRVWGSTSKQVDCDLIVTNRRLIVKDKDDTATYQREIFVDSIKSFQVRKTAPPFPWGSLILLICFTTLLIICLLALPNSLDTQALEEFQKSFLPQFCILLGCCIFLYVSAILSWFNSRFFLLILYTKNTPRTFARVSNLTQKKIEYTKIKIDKKCIEEITETLGALLLDL